MLVVHGAVHEYECPGCGRQYKKFKRDCVCGHRPRVKSQRRTLLLILLSILVVSLAGGFFAASKLWLE